MTRFVCKYEYSRPHSHAKHCWTCIGRHGAIHLHISDGGDEYGPSGGLEIHYRQPPDYMSEDAPSHEKCWLLGCPCWSDGSSSYATERWIPIWKADPHDHEGMFQLLQGEYRRRFCAEKQP